MSHWTSNAISAAYAAFRPSYPAALFQAVASRCVAGIGGSSASTDASLCVDVGCGSGQATVALADHFQRVIGVDPSQSQVDHATAHARVTYAVAPAEGFASVLPTPHSATCVTVAQAIHWFNMPAFVDQVDRALVQQPGALLAFWSYPLCTIENFPEVDRLLREVDAMLMGDGHWPRERKHVDNRYADIFTTTHFPDDKWVLSSESFPVKKEMTLDGFVSYMSTWSGVDRYRKAFPEKDLLQEFYTNASQYVKPSQGETATEAPLLSVVFNMETYYAARR